MSVSWLQSTFTQSLESAHQAWYSTSAAAAWGLVTFDWANSRQVWQNVHPHNNEELLTEQCRKIKALGTGTRCMVYRQNELSVQVRASETVPGRLSACSDGGVFRCGDSGKRRAARHRRPATHRGT